MKLTQVTDRVYVDTTGENAGNYGIVVLDDQVVVVDSGMYHTLTSDFREEVENEFGLPILKMVLTHYHPDHLFGAQALSPVSVIASAPTLAICKELVGSEWRKEKLVAQAKKNKDERPEMWRAVQDLDLKLPDIIFSERLQIGSGNDMTVELTGGHTKGSSIVIVEPDHIIFAGDLVFQGSFPYAGDPTCNPDDWLDALEGIKDAEVEQIVPGHGDVCGIEEIKRHIKFLRSLRGEILRAIEQGLSPEQFIEEGRTPSYYDEKSEGREKSAVEHWFEFYK
ncbi:MAG: MBL fold metallo-hydrolase [Candidatus Thorarchaeota archaeon]|nr:MBL fold metallo-hydrolase [Candidatus Thorarchaeota archaeon]